MNIQEVFCRALDCLQKGRPTDAIRDLLSIATWAEQVPLIDLALGTAFLDLNEYPKAIESFLRAKRRIPHNCELTYNLARAYRHSGRLGESAEELEDCLVHCPTSHRLVVLDNLAATYQALGQLEKCLYYLEEMFLFAPSGKHLRNLLKQLSESGYCELAARGALLIQRIASPNRLAQALAVENLADLVPTADFLAFTGYLYSRRQDYEQALTSFQEAYRLHPSDEILGEIGYQLNGLDRLLEAVAVYQDMVLRHPDNETVQYCLGNLLFCLDRFAEAHPHLLQAKGHGDDLPNYHYMLGYIALQHRDFGAARQRFQASLHLEPDFEQAQSGLLRLALLEEDASDVVQCVERLSRSGQLTLPQYEASLSLFKEKPSNSFEKKRVCEQLVRLIPVGLLLHEGDAKEMANDYHMLGSAYTELADWPRARAALEKALDLHRHLSNTVNLNWTLTAVYTELGITERSAMHPNYKGLGRIHVKGEIPDDLKVVPVYRARASNLDNDLGDDNLSDLVNFITSLVCTERNSIDRDLGKRILNPERLNRIALAIFAREPWTACTILTCTSELFPDYMDTYNNLGYVMPRLPDEHSPITKAGTNINFQIPLLDFTVKGQMIDFHECRIKIALDYLWHVLECNPNHIQARVNLITISSFCRDFFKNFSFELFGDLKRAIGKPDELWADVVDLVQQGGLLCQITESRNKVYVAQDNATNLAARVVFKTGVTSTLDRESLLICRLREAGLRTPHVLGRRDGLVNENYLVLLNEGESLLDIVQDLRERPHTSVWLSSGRTADESRFQIIGRVIEEMVKVVDAGKQFRSWQHDGVNNLHAIGTYDYKARIEKRFLRLGELLLGPRQGASWDARFRRGYASILSHLQHMQRYYYKDANPKNWLLRSDEKEIVVTVIDLETALWAAPQLDLVNLLEFEGMNLSDMERDAYIKSHHHIMVNYGLTGESEGDYTLAYRCAAVQRHCEIAGTRAASLQDQLDDAGSAAVTYHLRQAMRNARELAEVLMTPSDEWDDLIASLGQALEAWLHISRVGEEQ